jgi:anaerobic selenocysteine-containing dehydrogenase
MPTEENLKRIFEAKQKILEGSLTIWNERVVALSRAGDLQSYLDAIKDSTEPPIPEVTNNCNGCNVNCPRNCRCRRRPRLDVERELEAT